jgi:hypothetical protein
VYTRAGRKGGADGQGWMSRKGGRTRGGIVSRDGRDSSLACRVQISSRAGRAMEGRALGLKMVSCEVARDADDMSPLGSFDVGDWRVVATGELQRGSRVR